MAYRADGELTLARRGEEDSSTEGRIIKGQKRDSEWTLEG